ncbi:MAG: prolyl oligopeptidase family serine peptidase [Gemmatirosa sp.]|nr:prolyl oligopeptidase family serine peptidase [Gemmatirosa sp.]
MSSVILPAERRSADRRRSDRRDHPRVGAWWRRRGAWLVAAVATLASVPLLLRALWPAEVAPMARTERHTVVVGGRTRSYLLHHPAGWDAEQPLPLVLAFHGHRGDARTVRYESRLDDAADRARMLVAYPDGTGPLDGWPLIGGHGALTWNVGPCCAPASTERVDDEAFASAIVRQLAEEGAVDARRVYATGFSIGGTLALKLACDRASEFAAVADVEGTMPDARCTPTSGVSVLLVRGSDDDELRADLAENRARAGHRFADSMRGALRFWAARDGCAGPLTVARRRAWTAHEATACAAGLAAGLLVVPGNEHAWPGGRRPWLLAPRPAPDVPLSDSVLAFFRAHAKG